MCRWTLDALCCSVTVGFLFRTRTRVIRYPRFRTLILNVCSVTQLFAKKHFGNVFERYALLGYPGGTCRFRVHFLNVCRVP